MNDKWRPPINISKTQLSIPIAPLDYERLFLWRMTKMISQKERADFLTRIKEASILRTLRCPVPCKNN